MAFPSHAYEHGGAFAGDYFKELAAAAASVDREAVDRAARMLAEALDRDGIVYACGNGGSAAISDHLVCDCAKGVQTDTSWKPRVFSLAASGPFLTAISNDIAYAEAFAYQVRTFGRASDVLITISSSGNSENVVRAIAEARALGMGTISMTGFAGGRSRELADVNLHVEAGNYGIVEDIHQSLMHILAQYLRQSRMDPTLVEARTF